MRDNMSKTYDPTVAAELLQKSVAELLKTWAPPAGVHLDTVYRPTPTSFPMAPAGAPHSTRLKEALKAGKPVHAMALPNGMLEYVHPGLVRTVHIHQKKPVFMVHPPAAPSAEPVVKSEPILVGEGVLVPEYTLDEAKKMLLAETRVKLEKFEQDIAALRARELAKAAPTHADGSTAGSGVEGVPAAVMKAVPQAQPGNATAWEALAPHSKSAHVGWDTKGGFHCPHCNTHIGDQANDKGHVALSRVHEAMKHLRGHGVTKAEMPPELEKALSEEATPLCKKCGKAHDLSKACVAKAEPPAARPPSGNTHNALPQSKPAIPMAKAMPPPAAQAKQHALIDASRAAAPVAPEKPTSMPTPAENDARAAELHSMMPVVAPAPVKTPVHKMRVATGPVVNKPVQNAARPTKPGIFGRLAALANNS